MHTVRDTGIEPVLQPWQGRVVPTDSSHVDGVYFRSPVRSARLSFKSSQDFAEFLPFKRVTDRIRTGGLVGHNHVKYLPPLPQSPSQHQESNPGLRFTKPACILLHLAGVSTRTTWRTRALPPREQLLVLVGPADELAALDVVEQRYPVFPPLIMLALHPRAALYSRSSGYILNSVCSFRARASFGNISSTKDNISLTSSRTRATDATVSSM